MKAEGRPLKKLFNGVIRFEVPLFQRPYVWSREKNWEPLWEDIVTLAEKHLTSTVEHKHFIGAIVLDQVGTQMGDIETRQVIDGQQRLTTLQLILAAKRDLCAELQLSKLTGKLRTFTENGEDFIEQKDEIFKVWPTNRDQGQFRDVMSANSHTAVRERIGLSAKQSIPDGGIGAAYLYFNDKMRSWIYGVPGESSGAEPPETLDAKAAEQRADALWQAITEYLRVVVIDLEGDDDAQVIFETLNARGTQLLPADLVKNYLFHRVQRQGGDVEALYEETWSDFDRDFWRCEVRQGRLKRPRIDLFLQHFLVLRTQEEVNVGHIFDVYQNYAQKSNLTPPDLLREFGRYGAVCRLLFSPPAKSQLKTFMYRLNLIDTAMVMPVLLGVLHDLPYELNSEEVDAILVDLESYLVRRMLCSLTTKNYNAVFVDIVKHCQANGGFSATAIRHYLSTRESETNRWPSDEALLDAMKTNGIYHSLTRAKVRMTLEAIDLAMENEIGEKIQIQNQLTIEHLLPDTWETHWPLPTIEGFTHEQMVDRRNRLKHTIGNLTLLTQKLNSSVSNGPWNEKRTKIGAQTKLNMNQRLASEGNWSEKEIGERCTELHQLACQIWPRPAVQEGD